MQKTLGEKNHKGMEGNGQNVVSRYNLTLSNMCRYNLVLFFPCFCDCIPAEMPFYDSQITFSKLLMYL